MLIVANWKAYIDSSAQAAKLFATAKTLALFKGTQIVLAPSFVHLGLLSKGNRSKVAFAAQDISIANMGALTGEVTGQMIRETGALYAIIGHSERRARGEDNDIVLEKVQQALSCGLTPILCVGEAERDEDGHYLNFIRTELHAVFSVLNPKERAKVVIAYEPIWAIGKSAAEAITPTDLNEMIRYIRKVLREYMPEAASKKVQVLYGGSIDATNIKELQEAAPIDGFLIGRASTDPKTFRLLVKAVSV